MAPDDPTRWMRRIPSEDELKDYEDQARERRRLRSRLSQEENDPQEGGDPSA